MTNYRTAAPTKEAPTKPMNELSPKAIALFSFEQIKPYEKLWFWQRWLVRRMVKKIKQFIALNRVAKTTHFFKGLFSLRMFYALREFSQAGWGILIRENGRDDTAWIIPSADNLFWLKVYRIQQLAAEHQPTHEWCFYFIDGDSYAGMDETWKGGHIE